MPEESLPSSFGALLRDLVAWLDEVRVEGVVIGGLAAGILGRPRLTRDVDLLVTLEPERWEASPSRRRLSRGLSGSKWRG